MAFCVEQNINKTYICSACRQTIQMANQRLALFAFGNLKLQFSPPSQPYQTAEAERILLYFCQGSRIGGNFNLPKDLFFLLSMLRGFGEMGLRGTRLLALLKHSNSNLLFWICTNITKHNFPMNDECQPESSKVLSLPLERVLCLYWGVRFILSHHYIFA